MKIGYALVSTKDQNLELQLAALKKAHCTRIYEEKKSGKSGQDRPELCACLDSLREGDTLVIWKLDRLGRSLIDLVRIVERLHETKVQLVSLTEHIDTRAPTGKFLFHVLALLAEHERDHISERTTAGLATARARGRVGGAKKKTTPKQREQIRALHEARKFSIQEIADQFKISKPTVHRIVNYTATPHQRI
jgi:DNA invertase Pin-like site-specific DNA recombinase